MRLLALHPVFDVTALTGETQAGKVRWLLLVSTTAERMFAYTKRCLLGDPNLGLLLTVFRAPRKCFCLTFFGPLRVFLVCHVLELAVQAAQSVPGQAAAAAERPELAGVFRRVPAPGHCDQRAAPGEDRGRGLERRGCGVLLPTARDHAGDPGLPAAGGARLCLHVSSPVQHSTWHLRLSAWHIAHEFCPGQLCSRALVSPTGVPGADPRCGPFSRLPPAECGHVCRVVRTGVAHLGMRRGANRALHIAPGRQMPDACMNLHQRAWHGHWMSAYCSTSRVLPPTIHTGICTYHERLLTAGTAARTARRSCRRRPCTGLRSCTARTCGRRAW